MAIIQSNKSSRGYAEGEMLPLLPSRKQNRPELRQQQSSSFGIVSMSAIHVRRLYGFAAVFFLVGMVFLVIQQVFDPFITMWNESLFVAPTPKYYFAPATSAHPPSTLWGSIPKPYPTGAFWTNLVVNEGDGAAAVLPYGVKCLCSGIQVSYGPTRREVTNEFVRDTFAADLELSVKETYVKHEAMRFDELSVTMQYTMNGGNMQTPLVKGSPYLTVVYSGEAGGITPVISSITMRIINVEVRQFTITSPSHWYSPFVGKKDTVLTHYIVTLGNFQKWLVLFYSSDSSVNDKSKPFFHWNKEKNSLEGHKLSKGVSAIVRVAILPPQNVENSVALLLRHGSSYPTGGHTTFNVVSGAGDGADSAHVSYFFNTKQAKKAIPTSEVLMLALPHHVEVMTAPVTTEAIKKAKTASCNISGSDALDNAGGVSAIPCLSPLYSLKGVMTPVVGNTWSLIYPVMTNKWVYSVDPSAPISTEHLSAIGQALVDDVKVTYLEEPEDPYTVGKALARLAMLALLADNLGKFAVYYYNICVSMSYSY